MIISNSENIAAIDQMDRGLDKLRTIHMALCPDSKGWLDDKALLAIWGALDGTIRDLESVREAVNKAHASYEVGDN